METEAETISWELLRTDNSGSGNLGTYAGDIALVW